ncbi:LamG-like jellyroll fold domain-containing protein [Actinophytocola sp.]|uniref:LamG-like jellyroll fold domain-containing protein n=1 Tax=Actinophytocola sp. TaxID=1872138 RepID=UPI002D55ADDD|nr:LamG-like jellyroll fold domain-containing protein [Actinophytocola sp.]HYQ69724.1 LamG-like jellyroll fold domain-containing protein [Actinophytocola sp.]
MRRLVIALGCAVLAALSGTVPVSATGAGHHRPGGVLPSLRRDLVAYYDFEHVSGSVVRDQGRSHTNISLINGAPVVRDGFRHAVQLGQVGTAPGNDDWKAGTYSASGVPSLRAFNAAREATVMGWFKLTGVNPAPNTQTSNPDDFYNAFGLAGVLTGDSDGHAVRALMEVFEVQGQIRVVALGRRIDGGASQTFAANLPWPRILPPNQWVFLAATFDFDTGQMALYRNGKPLDGFYATAGDPWQLTSTPSPHLTTASDPRGIKIGGSFPQNTQERNPCNCRMDDLMFLNRALTPKEIQHQYSWTH